VSAEKVFRRFHGHDPDNSFIVRFNQPKKLVLLGEAVEIVYRSDKRAGGGTGKPLYFRHRFGKNTFLAADGTAKNQLYIIGDKLKITGAGIVG